LYYIYFYEVIKDVLQRTSYLNIWLQPTSAQEPFHFSLTASTFPPSQALSPVPSQPLIFSEEMNDINIVNTWTHYLILSQDVLFYTAVAARAVGAAAVLAAAEAATAAAVAFFTASKTLSSTCSSKSRVSTA